MSSPKKKKKDKTHDSFKTKQTKTKEHVYSEINFKFELREGENALSALKKFTEAAENYPEKTEYDIVSQYVQSSEECAEIFKLLEERLRKPQEILTIFSALECIFIRLSDASGKLELIRDGIVQRVLNYHMPVIYFSLGLNNKNQLIKKALRLLTRMVASSAFSARAVQTEMDFNHVNLLPLCQRRDVKDPQDVRTCFIQFIMAFLLIGDDIVVKQMVEQKVMIQKILQGIVSDKHENIQLILTTLLEKVVQNPTISKTAKIHLFTETILKHLTQLYSWQGPKHWKELKDKDATKTAVTASAEERNFVAEIIHEFLMELCCSFKTGINFFDNSLGTSGKNQNHILTGLLSSLQKSSSHPLSAELIISVLRACPDQLHHFLSMLSPSLNPRLSSGWMKNMDFLMKIYEAQPEKLTFLATKSPTPDLNYVTMALVYILPPDKILSSFTWGLKQPAQLVRHKILEFIKLALQRTINILASVKNMAEQDTASTVARELAVKLKEAVLKKLPDGATLLSCWNKIGADKSEKEQEMSNQDLPLVSSIQHMVRLEQVLCLYQELVPSLLSDNPNHVSSLLEGIRSVDVVVDLETESSKDQMLPQLYLLKLLAGTDARQLPWGRESTSKHTLMYLLLELIVKVSSNERLYDITQNLVGKLLLSTGLFQDQEQEVCLWLRQIYLSQFCQPPLQPVVVDFCARMFTTFISNPYPYMDRVAEIVAQLTVDQGIHGEGKKDKMEEKTIQEILAMDFDDTWDTATPSECREKKTSAVRSLSRRPFSPLTMVGLELLKNEEKYRKDTGVAYVLMETMVDILHTQVDPVLYATVVSQLTGSENSRQIQYITSWDSTDKMWKASKREKESTQASRLLQSLWQPDGNQTVDAKRVEKLIESVRSSNLQTQLLLAQQLLLYIQHTVRNVSKIERAEEFLETYFRVLGHVLDMVIQNRIKDSDSDLTGSEISSEFEMLDSRKTMCEEALDNLINVIFQHPTLVAAFRNGNLSNVSSNKLVSIDIMLTGCITSLLDKLKDVSLSTSVQKTFEPYAESISEALKKTELMKEGADQENLKLILRSLDSLLPFLNPASHYRTFLEKLLEFPSRILVSKGKAKKLGKAGQLAINLASESLASLKDGTKATQLLPLEKVSALMNLMIVSSDKFLENFCEHLLKAQPAYVLAVRQDLCEYLFENPSSVEAAIVETLLNQSVVSRMWFETWLRESLETVAESSEKYANMVTCYIRGEGGITSGRNDVQKCLETIEKLYMSDISHLHMAQSPTVRVVYSLVASDIIGQEKLSRMWTHLSFAIMEDPNILQCHIELLVLLYNKRVLGSGDITFEKGEDVVGDTETLTEVLMKILVGSAGRKHGRSLDVEEYCLKILGQVLEKQEALLVTEKITSLWLDFVKVCLKVRYSDPVLLTVIEKLVPLVYVESHDISPPVEMLYEMLMSHSQFMQVMLGEKGQEVKGQMVSLLLTLVEMCPDCCHPDHQSVLQGAYGATLSDTDQKLLKIMFLYEKTGKGLADAKPFLWGPKAVEHYALRKSLASSLLKQTSMEQIMEAFSVKRMYKSILHFPIGRQLTPDILMAPKEHQSTEEAYDPCFVLPLFCGLLSSDSLVDCRKFVSSHCLGYTLTALSSHAPGVRKAAYTVLARFLDHLATVKFHERLQVTYLLDTVRNSVQQVNERLSCLITLFLARVSRLLLHPDEHMYRQMNNFLLLKPSLDTMNVPEFYKLFNSADLQHKVERTWILSLLSDGLREMADYKIMERRFTFKLLQSFYDSAMSDQNSQTRVLRIVKAACSGRPMAMDLAKNHGLLTWISGAILKDVLDSERGELLASILHTLWFTMAGDSEKSLPLQFVRETLICCKRLLTHVRHQEFSITALLFLMETMVSALAYMTKPIQGTLQDTFSTETISVKEVLLLLHSYCQLQQETETAAQLRGILDNLGIHVQLTKPSAEKKKKWRKYEEELFDDEDKMEEEYQEKEDTNKQIDSELTDKKEQFGNQMMDITDKNNIPKVLNHVCTICLHWNPRDGVSSVVKDRAPATGSLSSSIDNPHLSGALVTVSWILSHFHHLDSSEQKTKLLTWVLSLVSVSDNFSTVLRAMMLDSSNISSPVFSSLSSVYNDLFKRTRLEVTEIMSPETIRSEDEDSILYTLKTLNSIVLCLVEQQSGAGSPVHVQFTSKLSCARTLCDDKSLVSQEKLSLLLREWLLGSWSVGHFRHVDEETGQLRVSSDQFRDSKKEVDSPGKRRKRRSGPTDGAPSPSPSKKTKKKKM